MQAIIEVAKGLSTGFVVWAGKSACSHTLQCSVCPDCHRSCRDDAWVLDAPEGYSLLWLVVVFGVGIVVVGAVLNRLLLVGWGERPCRHFPGVRGVVLQIS